MTPIASILAVGAQTPLGIDACQTGMLSRAGFATMEEAPLGIDGQGVILCRTAALPDELTGAERLVALATPALQEALGDFSGADDDTLFVLELDAELPEDRVEHLAGALVARCKKSLSGIRLEVVRKGAGGGVPAVEAALAKRQPVLWGGVHSDHDELAIGQLVARDRLYADDNLDAVLPGESAAFVRLAPGEKSEALAALVGLGHAVELARSDNDLPAATARAITSAMRAATAPLEKANQKAGWAVSDLGLEDWRMREWQSLTVRAASVLTSPYRFDNPAQRMGRLGAAGMPLGITLVTEGLRRGWAPSPIALVFGGSDAGERGAATVVDVASPTR